MAKKQSSDVDMKEELMTAQILTAVFVSFMILIVGSYSDVSEAELKRPITPQTLVQSIDRVKPSTQAPIIIKTHLNQSVNRI